MSKHSIKPIAVSHASTKSGKTIHISEAELDAEFYCIGCKGKLILIKDKIPTDHFRHYAHDVQRKANCVFRDETYRHKVAIEILQRIKKIKVPTLKKYPPYPLTGQPNILAKSRFITAHSVVGPRRFYHDVNGKIRYGIKKEVEETTDKFNLIEPDVTFFNKDNEPILFIEIVVTHDIDEEKLAKVTALGIDMVKVKIPNISSTEIERSFLTTKYTKWVFNYEQETTQYIQLPPSDRDTISNTSWEEEEAARKRSFFNCTKAEIKNLIRGIRQCLQLKSYIEAEARLSRELEQVKRIEAKNRIEWRAIEARIIREVEAIEKKIRRDTATEENQSRKNEENIRNRIQENYRGVTDQLRRESEELLSKHRNLEERYRLKDREIKAQQSDNQERVRMQLKEETDRVEQGERELCEEKARFDKGVEISKQRIQQPILETTKRIRELESAIFDFATEQAEAREQAAYFDKETRRIEAEIKSISDRYRKAQREIRELLESENRAIIDSIRKRDVEGSPRTKRGIERILATAGLPASITKRQSIIKRYRNIKEALDTKDYKNWDA